MKYKKIFGFLLFGTIIGFVFYLKNKRKKVMDDEVIFKNFVDNVKSTLDLNKIGDLNYLYNYFEINITGSISRDYLEKVIRERIKNTISSEDNEGLNFNDLRKLKSQLLLKKILDSIDCSAYLPIIDELQNVTRKPQKIKFLKDKREWKSAIKLIIELNKISIYKEHYDDNILEITYCRDFRIGYAAKYLRGNGFQLEIRNGSIYIEDLEIKRIVEKIEKLIEKIGGLEVAYKIFQLLANKFDEKQQRYHLVRILSNIPQYNEPSVPFGFLLNLCVKHLSNQYNSSNDGEWEDLLFLTTNLAAIYGVEPSNLFENLFTTQDNLIELIIRIKLYDNMFSLIQLRPDDVCKILLGLFNWVDNYDYKIKFGFSFYDIVMFICIILDQTKEFNGPVIIDVEKLNFSTYPISIDKINKIIDILSHNSGGINVNFKLPSDYSNENFSDKPFVRNNSKLLIMDRSWCSPSFYEAVATELRKNYDEKADDKIGFALEEFIKEQLFFKNITFCFGKYKVGKMEYECDLVVECKNTIIFIEIKKKGLTRKAREGKDVKLLIDICKSLLNSQIQIGQHELTIRKNGFIDLKNNMGTYKLNLNGRQIERISLSLLDFGGFQDRTIIDQLLRTIEESKFQLYEETDIESKKEIEKINNNAKVLLNQTQEIYQITGKTSGLHFMHAGT